MIPPDAVSTGRTRYLTSHSAGQGRTWREIERMTEQFRQLGRNSTWGIVCAGPMQFIRADGLYNVDG